MMLYKKQSNWESFKLSFSTSIFKHKFQVNRSVNKKQFSEFKSIRLLKSSPKTIKKF